MSWKGGVVLLGIVVLFILAMTSFTTSDNQRAKEKKIKKALLEQVNDFESFVGDSLSAAALQEPLDVVSFKRQFLKTRLLFKRFEWAVEYFSGDLAKRLNGPPVEEIENADLLDPTLAFVIEPSGLQVIEEIIFPDFKEADREQLVKEIALLLKNVGFFSDYISDLDFPDWRLLDAAKMEVFRVVSLGITGFDNPLTLHSAEESVVALKGVGDVMKYFGSRKQKGQWDAQLQRTLAYLKKNNDFDAFDRAEFILKYADPLSTAINSIQTYPIRYNRLLNQEANTLFDSNAINADAFVADLKYGTTPQRVVLGKKLFFDPSLSRTGTRSCATCHQPDKGFADGLVTNTNIHDSSKHLPRNTPTLLNAALQSNQFYDMRALTLEDQAHDVITNPDEMDGSLGEIAQKLNSDTAYKRMFLLAYPDRGKKIDTFEIVNALASFTRGELTKLDSRFDRYMRGDRSALTPSELRGFNLFAGKAKCATCHFMPLFNGLMPPKFVENDAEVIGVPNTLKDSVLSPDRGYYDIIGMDSYKHSFKTPTVRNIDKTAPYMHNGVYSTLEEVMDFYNNAGAVGLGFSLPNNTLPEQKLNLTDDEIADIIAFMKSL